MGRWALAFTMLLHFSPVFPLLSSNVQEQFRVSPINARKSAEEASLLAVERELSKARESIRHTVTSRENSSGWSALGDKDTEFVPRGEVYRNPALFYRSYAEMEKRFKLYVYKEGEAPLFHAGPCKGIYTTEGRFINAMEILQTSKSTLLTSNPFRAHAFFLPFSVAMMARFAYRDGSHDIRPLRRIAAAYVGAAAARYPFWNRSAGADHFMLSCHDWGPLVSASHPLLFSNSIRALCNANLSEGFHPSNDVSIPEINLHTGHFPLELLPPLPTAADRPILAFFAGGDHGPIRPSLLHHWRHNDSLMSIQEQLPGGAAAYYNMMRRSKFCICPSGYEVASPRVVEAIYAECVPVMISEGYVAPFGDVLKWEKFSLWVTTAEIPRLKEILEGVSEVEYRKLQGNLAKVKPHFVFNSPPKRFDVFHMMLHSVWLRRLNKQLM